MSVARRLRALAVLILIVVVYFIVPVRDEPATELALRALVSVLLLGVLAAVVVVQVRRALADPDSRVDGLLTVIVMVWTTFALGFFVLDNARPDEVAGLETRLDALYFTASTMLTVGYGDVHAVGQVARGLVVVQLVFDVAFVATAGGVLSSRVRARAARRAANGPSSSVRRRRRAVRAVVRPEPPRQG